MKILRAVILVFVFLLPSANAFGAVKAFIHDLEVDPGGDDAQTKPTGIQFNPDGTKMYENKYYKGKQTSSYKWDQNGKRVVEDINPSDWSEFYSFFRSADWSEFVSFFLPSDWSEFYSFFRPSDWSEFYSFFRPSDWSEF